MRVLADKKLNLSDYPEEIKVTYINKLIWGYIATGAFFIAIFTIKSLPLLLIALFIDVAYWALMYVEYYKLTRDRFLYLEGEADKIVDGFMKTLKYIRVRKGKEIYLIPYKKSYGGRYEDGCRIELYITNENIMKNSDGMTVLEAPAYIFFSPPETSEKERQQEQESNRFTQSIQETQENSIDFTE